VKEINYKYPNKWTDFKHTLKIILLVCFLATKTVNVNAQECVNQGFVTNQCGCDRTDFRPVCGCDGKTYLNTCMAFSCGAVTSYKDFPCGEMFVYQYPSLLTNGQKLNFYIGVKQRQSATVIIYDVYGKVQFTKLYPYLDEYFPYKIEFPAESFPLPGVYFIMTVLPNGYYQITKFLRYNI